MYIKGCKYLYMKSVCEKAVTTTKAQHLWQRVLCHGGGYV